ncbi:hypothetical protein GDO86_019274 [Hymenochirus boettgeri]|uniref:G-protein coupled receptors family 1 profile domain-containing protein n=1 Tax=Hymenochirus boettgeri TaxID=247094 RepID=A0A8T2ILH8_9PIPI|nr:hypothetical protein GDO86_019274 [Hymenochirus boettgeri]
MYHMNQTLINEFFLLGFPNLQNFTSLIFTLFLLIYLLTICENILIIVLVSTSQNLRSPMYFFLQCLSTCDLVETTTIVPILLQTIINGGITMSFPGCITQLYCFSIVESFQCLLLSVMSYDRYLAICNPLRYTSLMNQRHCIKLVNLAFMFCSITEILTVSGVANLQFSVENTIDHFFCDLAPLLDLSCSDTSMLRIHVLLLSIPVVIFPVIIIILSYVCIIHSILKITSSSGRQKAFSTCSSHLSVVLVFFGTLISIYMVPPRKQLLTINKVLSLSYTVFIPLVNPVIYTLRNKDIKDAFRNILQSRKIIKIKVLKDK